jgi:hypothetical protein
MEQNLEMQSMVNALDAIEWWKGCVLRAYIYNRIGEGISAFPFPAAPVRASCKKVSVYVKGGTFMQRLWV